MTKLVPPTHILIATVAGLLLVAGAWTLKPDTPSAASTAAEDVTNSVQVTRPAQRPYIDVVDSDGNGIPDWQEALQQTEPLTVPNATSSYEAPDTLTDQFALEFFEQYMRGERYGAFGTNPEELVQQSGEALANQAKDQPITRSQVSVSADTSTEAIAMYGEQIAAIIATHSRTDTEQELTIVDRAIRLNDRTELEKLDPIIEVYENILTDTLTLTVPQTYVTEHLILVNAYQAVLNDIKAMRVSFDDPMRSLLRTQRYQEDIDGMYNAIVGLYEKLRTAGITWDEDSPVYSLVEIR